MGDLLASLLILAGLVAGAFVLIGMKRANPDKPLTDTILSGFRSSFTGWFLIILCAATLGECLAAATTHGEGGEINGIARIIAHLCLGLFQLISAMGVTASIQALISSTKKRDGRAIILTFIQSFVLFIGIFYAPIANLYIMASTLQEIPQLNFFFYSLKGWIPWSGVGDIQIMARAMSMKLPEATSPFQLLSSPIMLLLATIGCHILIMMIEICHSLLTDHTVYAEIPDVNGTSTAPTAPTGNTPPPNTNSNPNLKVENRIKDLIGNLGLGDKDKVKTTTDAIKALAEYDQNLPSGDESMKGQFTQLITRLHNIHNKWKNNPNDPDLNDEIISFLTNGLGQEEDGKAVPGLGIIYPN